MADTDPKPVEELLRAFPETLDEGEANRIFEEILVHVGDQIYRWARRSMNDPVEALDVEQEVRVKLVHALYDKKFETPGHLFGFLRSVTLHACVDRIRRTTRRTARENVSGAQTPENTPPESEELEEVLSQLKDDEREILEAFAADELDAYVERLGIPKTTLWKRKSRALEKARNLWEKVKTRYAER